MQFARKGVWKGQMENMAKAILPDLGSVKRTFLSFELHEYKAVFGVADKEVSQLSDEITVNCAPLV